jgi:prepilin-type processing-associated H-X9-DG protein
VELLISLGLLIALWALYWGFGSPSNQRRQKVTCQSHQQKIHVALEIYAHDHGGTFPLEPSAKTSEEALDGLVPKYSVDTSIFICPGCKDSELPGAQSFRKSKISYAYYMGRRGANAHDPLLSDRQVNTLAKEQGENAFSPNGRPPGNNHHKYGGVVLFCDGHCESSPARVRFPLPLGGEVKLLNPKP